MSASDSLGGTLALHKLHSSHQWLCPWTFQLNSSFIFLSRVLSQPWLLPLQQRRHCSHSPECQPFSRLWCMPALWCPRHQELVYAFVSSMQYFLPQAQWTNERCFLRADQLRSLPWTSSLQLCFHAQRQTEKRMVWWPENVNNQLNI